MEPFYEALGLERTEEVATLTQTMYEAREYRRSILTRYNAGSEAELLARVQQQITEGQGEHPLYEHYLAALILEQNRLGARTMVSALLSNADLPLEDVLPPQLQLHQQLCAHRELQELLCEPPRLRQDSLLLLLHDQIEMTVFCASPEQYSIRWEKAGQGDTVMGIDTAPGHPNLPEGARSHLHTATGQIAPDLLTSPGQPPVDNILAVVRAIRNDAALQPACPDVPAPT